ncbi:MAG: alanine--tRNA ligase [Bacteroidetes bacterium 4572_117]|nr:MAG: alanine--tRNA ligase [Bacteroidetes bacterium 4572_117]
MTSHELRNAFLDFFEKKSHKIVTSAPMVVKNDPTLMFTNAGMNQFKDIFLGQSAIVNKRVADSQKCLRVSGKHNDLEEVGHDTYHHTMFEMLGNWSFGDYFKKEAIDWAWEFLTGVLGIPKNRFYATVFEGDKSDNLKPDDEAKSIWLKHLDSECVLYGSKKDNFWEMGETGPCGPCSELHVDIRSDEERAKIPGRELVNEDHPLVIEIWNLVFIQFNRKADTSLEPLPHKHVDTGMGFERLAMIVQGKQSNYDTDVFQPIIQEIGKISGFVYGENNDKDIAMRVIADHLRTIVFAIADGQLPSNNKAGYVIRRILRRAVRYAYTFLKVDEPLIYKLLDTLIEIMGEAYPELSKQKTLIGKVIREEEISFLRTLATGINLLDKIITNTKKTKYEIVSGKQAFELYDTFGFPLDLTELILRENGLIVNKKEFDKEMAAQKSRSRQDANVTTDDWVVLKEDDVEEFVGYDFIETNLTITKYRKTKVKAKELYHLVFNLTPFYAESGGQVGDKGYIENASERIYIVDTKKEHNQIIHITEKFPANIEADFKAVVDSDKRRNTEANHSATHLLHLALRKVLGKHVEQKGSLVDEKHLRFDFSHFQRMTKEEILDVEFEVNKLIRSNILLEEKRNIPIKKANELGALSLFGEKYGDVVRVIRFGESVEFCGGTHVNATGQIGYFVITSESAIAAGIRRVEAITSLKAEEFIKSEISTLTDIKALFKNKKNITETIEGLLDENLKLKKQIDQFHKQKALNMKSGLKNSIIQHNGINILAEKIDLDSAQGIKDIAFQLKGEIDNLFLVLGSKINDKANIAVMISEKLVKEKDLHAGKIIKEISKEIQGGGGGQAFFATAGGRNPEGIEKAIEKAVKFVKK